MCGRLQGYDKRILGGYKVECPDAMNLENPHNPICVCVCVHAHIKGLMVIHIESNTFITSKLPIRTY